MSGATDVLWCLIDHGHDANGPRQVQADAGWLCQNHANRLRTWLREVAIDYALLATRIAPIKSATDYSSDGRGGGDEAAAPLNLAIVALRDAERGGAPRPRGDELWYELPDIPSVLATVHARAEALRGELDPARDYDDSLRDRTVTGEVNYLLGAFAALCDANWVDEAFTDIKHLWVALQRAHDRPRPTPIGPCLDVDCSGTVWPRPEAQPWCSKCKRVYPDETDWIKIRIEAEKTRNQKAIA